MFISLFDSNAFVISYNTNILLNNFELLQYVVETF